MALFRRRRRDDGDRTPARPADPDEALTFLGAEDAQRVRALVRDAFARRGIEVTVYVDHVVDDSGRQFGLWNVAAACHQDDRGRSAWADVVDQHVGRVLASMDAPDPFDGLTPEQARQRTYARLYERDGIPDLTGFPHQEFAPGLVEMIALDLPDAVVVYNEERAEAFGGADLLRTWGRETLRREPVERHERIDLPDGGWFDVLLGSSVHTASRALLMPSLAAEVAGEEAGRHGWLLSVPNRQQVVWHLVRDISVLPSLQAMAGFASAGFSDSPGPLSPHVYWWDGTAYQQLTRIDDDGALAIVVEADFQAVLEELARDA
ncbi:hypothetical protein BJ993_004570 [Nocardioides aromaticivorans]|uniref:Uncharacterized protein n=1 Tax=Nocardioides aromaticivorans TaxID=200618 RepID=A0A7Z0CQZ2_9ACTN|nr:hypothetical protein [Nocardioides aromaticivorans]NYI47490.1 hypothetical protein [Nocardioides aromaticivorans]